MYISCSQMGLEAELLPCSSYLSIILTANICVNPFIISSPSILPTFLVIFFFFLLLSVMFPPLFPNNTTENQLWLFSQRKLALHSLCLLGPLWGYIYIFLSFEKHFLLLLFFILFLWMFFFFLISWRLITLQYCSGFCHTLTWISLGYTCIPHNSFTWFISFSREELILYVPNGSLNLCFFPLNDQNPK